MITVHPGTLEGAIAAPTSKSIFQRAVALATLCDEPSTIRHRGLSEDCQAAIRAARGLGSEVDVTGETVAVAPGRVPRQSTIDCGESGLTLRMFAPVAALGTDAVELTARGSLASRPMGMIQEALCALGATCRTREGTPPVDIRGPLRGGEVRLDARGTSQVLTGLMLALPRAERDSHLRIDNLVSKPYLQLTSDLVAAAGAHLEMGEEFSSIKIPGGQSYKPLNITVEGDWSGAAFFLVAAALGGDISVSNLSLESRQADIAVLTALRRAEAWMQVGGDTVRVRAAALRGFEMDLNDCPDLFPPLAVLALGAKGRTVLRGASRLAGKETDRAAALVEELRALGGSIHVQGDQMLIEGSTLRGGEMNARGDHRMVMAGAIAALRSRGAVVLHGHETVAKSYPRFFEDLEEVGGKLS